MGVGKNLFELASMIAAIALISMFVKNSQQTSQLITAGTDAFGGLLKTATNVG